MRKSNYDKKPSVFVQGMAVLGWDAILDHIKNDFLFSKVVVVVDCYTGVYHEELIHAFKMLNPDFFVETSTLMKGEADLLEMTSRNMTEDQLFGVVSDFRMGDFFDAEKLQKAKDAVLKNEGLTIVYGHGASMVVDNPTLLIYADMARWEIQQRMRRKEVLALGVDNRAEAISYQYKRGFFNDWKVCDRHKETLFPRVDYWLDTHIRNQPKMITRETFMNGMKEVSKRPFRVVPFFDPAPWGGQWMKEVCDLDRTPENYGWCFDCVPEENSLFLNVEGVLFEMPSVNVVLLESKELLGEAVEARFGKDFPIRFDFLDTISGGNLSLQVHPTTEYARKHFGIPYTQDESYYLMDATEDAVVYIGLKENVDKEAMIEDLRKAQQDKTNFDAEKYVNKFPAKKHDHYLIPGGTIHCSGAGAMVLEISATPNLFTFKLWDWGRLGLDGKPRPINIEHGKEVIAFDRDTNYALKQLVNVVTPISEGDGWSEESTGLHPNEFIETRRHWFEKSVLHHTNGGVNVLNLIEGEEVTLSSPSGAFKPYVIHYAETFIVPAQIGEYVITPSGNSVGKTCGTIKAFVRFNA